jgi:DNA polymerase III subunit epsilon
MFDWIKNINKPYPEFWKSYLSKFDEKPIKYIVIATETTGLNPTKDVILSFGAVAVENDTIVVSENFEVVIPQYNYLHENGITNDFFLESSLPKMAEALAIENIINFIGNATLVGHRIHFDIEIINEALDKLACGRLKNDAFDIEVMYKKLHDINDKNFSLDELSKFFKIEKTDRISTSDDAFTIALLFLKLKSRLGLK